MKSEMCLMPVRCSSCNELFDLQYDLAKRSEYMDMEEFVRAVSKKLTGKGKLCWECRDN